MSVDCNRKYDYIIVGAGGSGAVLARTLLDRCLVSVLVLEMGRNNNNNPIVYDATNVKQAETSPVTAEEYLTQRDPNVLNTQSIVSQGRGWGGTTAQDDMMAIRPSQTYLRQIESMTGIPLALMNSYFKRIERYIPRPGSNLDSSRGTEGPMDVTQLALGSTPYSLQRLDSAAVINAVAPASNGFIELMGVANAVPALQFPADDYNAIVSPEAFVGAHQQAFVSDMGNRWVRQQTGSKYLTNTIVYPNGKGSSNYDITIIDRAKVTKINFSPVNAKCTKAGCTCSNHVRPTSVDAWVDLKCCTFYANCGVILTAGPFENPALLQRSGIGPSSVLDQLCINKIITNEHVGRHLVGHYGSVIDFWLQFSPPTIPDPAQVESNLSLIAELPDAFLTTSLPSSIYPSSYVPTRAKQMLGTTDGTAPNGRYAVEIDYWSNLPRTEGSVEIIAADAFSKPNINMPAFATAEERSALVATWRQVATQLNNYVAAYNGSHPPTLSLTWPYRDPMTSTDEEILQTGLENVIKIHPCSTCRMASVGFGVVDTSFQVYGTCGLYVADISVLPIIPDADPSWTTMVIGMHFAETIALNCNRRRCDPNSPDSYSLCRTITCCDCGSDPCTCRDKKTCNIQPYNKCDDDCCESPCRKGDCGKGNHGGKDKHGGKGGKKPKPCAMATQAADSSKSTHKKHQQKMRDSSSGIYGWK